MPPATCLSGQALYEGVADLTGPTATFGPVAVAVNGAFDAALRFDEPVAVPEVGAFLATNATVEAVTVSPTDPTRYAVRVVPGVDGEVVLTLPAGAAIDGAGNALVASATLATVLDTRAPTASAGVVPALVGARFEVVLSFDEPIEGFEPRGSGNWPTRCWMVSRLTRTVAGTLLELVPLGSGAVTATLSAAAVSDAAGNGNAATVLVETVADLDPPQATIVDAPVTATGAFDVRFGFAEPTDAPGPDALAPVNATVETVVAGGRARRVRGARDTAGRGRGSRYRSGPVRSRISPAMTAWPRRRSRCWSDTVAPVVSVGPLPAQVGATFELKLAFSEPVTGLAPESIAVDNGTVTDLVLAEDGLSARVTVAAAGDGPLSVELLGDAAGDAGRKRRGRGRALRRPGRHDRADGVGDAGIRRRWRALRDRAGPSTSPSRASRPGTWSW